MDNEGAVKDSSSLSEKRTFVLICSYMGTEDKYRSRDSIHQLPVFQRPLAMRPRPRLKKQTISQKYGPHALKIVCHLIMAPFSIFLITLLQQMTENCSIVSQTVHTTYPAKLIASILPPSRQSTTSIFLFFGQL